MAFFTTSRRRLSSYVTSLSGMVCFADSIVGRFEVVVQHSVLQPRPLMSSSMLANVRSTRTQLCIFL